MWSIYCSAFWWINKVCLSIQCKCSRSLFNCTICLQWLPSHWLFKLHNFVINLLLACLSIITPPEEKLIFGCWQEVRVPRTPVFPSPLLALNIQYEWNRIMLFLTQKHTVEWRHPRTETGEQALVVLNWVTTEGVLSLTVTWSCFQEHAGREVKNNINHKQLWKKTNDLLAFLLSAEYSADSRKACKL